MNFWHAVEIRNGKQAGSGFLIGPGLILTAWHVLRPATGAAMPSSFDVRVLDDYRRATGPDRFKSRCARLLWPAAEAGANHDFALLQLVSDDENSSYPFVDWSDMDNAGEVGVQVIGFPDFGKFSNTSVDSVQPPLERDTVVASGRVQTGSRLKQREVYGSGSFEVVLREEDLPKGSHLKWQGISGAPVFVGDVLIGVVVKANEERPEVHRLVGLPVARLFAADGVRHALALAGITLPPATPLSVQGFGLGFASQLLDRFGVARHAPAEFRAGVEHFLTGYLGKPGRPVAFAGRDDMLSRLNRCVDGASAARILLHAPGGRGKSALVVQWLQHAAERFHLVFLPISARSDTNRPHLFYQALATRLAEILRVKPALPTFDDPAHYRALAIDYLRGLHANGKPVLLVIDGLDEAAGWELPRAFLPSLPASSLTVVVSARERAGDNGANGWIEQLGWRRDDPDVLAMSVDPLDEAGVADVVASSDGVRTGQDYGGIARRIMQLSGGDPWLVGLYVDDLRRDEASGALLLPPDVADRRPGFGPLFHAWIAEQKQIWSLRQRPVDEEGLRSVLAILSCAFGPLHHDALADIYRVWRGEAAILPREAIEPISRFLQGDGTTSGYVLAHPRFAEFLRKDYFGDQKILHDARAAILGWGMAVVAALDAQTLDPSDCPSYLVTYLGQHLVDALAPVEQMMRLVGEGWLAARYRSEGSHGGFAEDVRRAADAVELRAAADERRWSWRLRCQLTMGSITNTGTLLPAPLIVECVHAGALTASQGLRLIEQKMLNAPPLAAYDLDESQAQSEAARALVELARAWPSLPGGVHGLDDVLRVIGMIGNEHVRAEALTEIAGLRPAPPVGECLFAALSIGSDTLRSGVVGAFVPAASEGLLARALEHALVAAGSDQRGGDWSTTLDVLAQSVPDTVRRAAMSRAQAQAAGRSDPAVLASVLVATTRFMPHKASEALDACAAVPDEMRRAALLDALGRHVPEGQLAVALGNVLAFDDTASRWKALRSLLPRLPADLLGTAVRSVMTWDASYERASALDAIVRRGVDESVRPDVFAAATASVWALPAGGAMFVLLSNLIVHAPDERQREVILNRALDTIGTMKDEQEQASGLGWVADHLTGPFLGRAIELVAGMQDGMAQRSALERLLPRLPDAMVPAVFRIVQQMKDGFAQDETLGALVPVLPAVLFPDALAVVEAPGGKGGGRALVALAPRLPDDLLPRALVAALHTISRGEHQQTIGTMVQRMRPETLDHALSVLMRHFAAVASLPGIVYLVTQLPDRILPVVLTGLDIVGAAHARVDILAAMLPRLEDAALADVRRLIDAVRTEEYRAKGLVALALRLPAGAEREQVFTDALEVMRGASSSHECAVLLDAMVPHLPARMLDDALEVTGHIRSETQRARVLGSMAGRLHGALIPRSWNMARAMSSARPRAQAMAAVAKCFATSAERAKAFEQALQSFMTIDDLPARVLALAAHLPLLPDDGTRADVAREALALAGKIVDAEARHRALGQLAPHSVDALCALLRAGASLPRSSFVDLLLECEVAQNHQKTIEAMAESLDDRAQEDCLRGLMNVRLPEASRRAYLMRGLALRDEGDRASFIRASADRFTSDELKIAVRVARRITNKFERDWAMSALRPYLPVTRLAKRIAGIFRRPVHDAVPADVLVEKRLQDAAAFDDFDCARELIDIAPALPERLSSAALRVCAGIEYEFFRAKALAALAPSLAGSSMPAALELAAGIRFAETHGRAIAGLAPCLPDSLLEQVLDRIEAMRSDRLRSAHAIMAMAPSLKGKDALLQRAIAFAVPLLRDGEDAANAIAALASQLPFGTTRSGLLEVALAMAERVPAAPARIRCLRALLPVLPPSLHERAACGLLAAAGTTPRAHLLDSMPSLFAHVDGFKHEVSVRGTCQAVRDVGRWFP